MKSKQVFTILGIVIVIAVVALAYSLTHKSATKTTTTNQMQASTSSSNTNTNTIVFDGSSFSPTSITVKSGSIVTIKNSSSEDMNLDSDPHPIHTDDTDLNVGDVPAGQSKTFTVHKQGSFGYHDHLDPSIQGKITIQ